MNDDEPVGRARWTGLADGPLRRTRHAQRRVGDFTFVARQGASSGWQEVHRLEDLERFECDPDMETEWYAE